MVLPWVADGRARFTSVAAFDGGNGRGVLSKELDELDKSDASFCAKTLGKASGKAQREAPLGAGKVGSFD